MAVVEHDTRWGPPPSPPTGPPTPSRPRRNRLAAAIIASAVVVLAVVVIAATATGVSHHTKPQPAVGTGGTAPRISTPASGASTPRASTPVTPSAPSTVVGSSGNPADWPAAQPNPPSLDGLFNAPPDFVAFVKTLNAYIGWAYAHPDPALVANYMLSGSSYYKGQVSDLTFLKAHGWHPSDLSPTEIDFIKVTEGPQPYPAVNGKPFLIQGHPGYRGGAVVIVFNFTGGSYLDSSGHVARTFPAAGQVAYLWTLAQGLDGRWRIADEGRLNPPGGIASLEHP